MPSILIRLKVKEYTRVNERVKEKETYLNDLTNLTCNIAHEFKYLFSFKRLFDRYLVKRKLEGCKILFLMLIKTILSYIVI